MAEAPSGSASTSSPLLVVVGAGPKAAALAAKARVLKHLGHQSVRILVIERQEEIAGNWTGSCGFTTGDVHLCTPPEKDVGFPYTSAYGSEVDREMLGSYSWHAYKILFDRSSYSDWVDTDHQHPTHAEWARYIRNTLKSAMTKDDPSEPEREPRAEEEELVRVRTGTSVEAVEPENGKVKITVRDSRRTETIYADGIVFTGPGEPIQIKNTPSDVADLIYDSRSYWERIKDFAGMDAGKIAVIGGGESAASVVVSLLEFTRSRGLEVDIINRHGAVFTRGESYNESKWFSNPGNWSEMDEEDREEIIKRTDRGVFSVAAQNQLKRARKVNIRSGHVFELQKHGEQISVAFRRGKPSKEERELYDKVIVALGFNPWVMLDLFPPEFRPTFASKELREHYRNIERNIDRNLLLNFDFVPGMEGVEFNVHVPVVAGLAQGPGFPSLCCLGHLSDRILARYRKPPRPLR